MASLQRKEGYFLLENRHAPAPDAAALQAETGQIILAPSAAVFETATITCCHCNTTFFKNPDRTRPRGYCPKCDDYQCDLCVAVGECRPFQQLIDELQAAAAKGV